MAEGAAIVVVDERPAESARSSSRIRVISSMWARYYLSWQCLWRWVPYGDCFSL
jgi:hypothetical protein